MVLPLHSIQVPTISKAMSMLDHCGWMNDLVAVEQAVVPLEQAAVRGVTGQRRAWRSRAVIVPCTFMVECFGPVWLGPPSPAVPARAR